jgi:hypothetical protein
MSWNKIDLKEVFSEREQEILKVIGKKRTMTVDVITKEVFMHHCKNDVPFDAEITIRNSISRIIRKCEVFNIHWTLKKTKSDGRMIITKEFL